MKKMMFIGEAGSGKASLIRALSKANGLAESFVPMRAMSVQYFGPFINTPGEFLENRRFYRSLITAAMDCDILAMVQDATRPSSLYPPLFATFFSRRVIGVITKTGEASAQIERAERFLVNAGAKEHICVNVATGEGIDALNALIQ